MVFDKAPIEKLNTKKAASVALVMLNIKDAQKRVMLKSGDEKVYASFKLPQAIESIYIHQDLNVLAEKTHLAILQYLWEQQIINDIKILNNNTNYDYVIEFLPDKFNQYYQKVMVLTLPFIDSNLRNIANPLNLSIANQIPLDKSLDKTKIYDDLIPGKVSLIMYDKNLTIKFPNNIERIFCSYRPNLGPYNIMRYLFSKVSSGEIPVLNISILYNSEYIEGAGGYGSVSDALRACGFNKYSKRIFFERDSRNYKFTPKTIIDKNELKYLIKNIEINTKKRKSKSNK